MDFTSFSDLAFSQLHSSDSLRTCLMKISSNLVLWEKIALILAASIPFWFSSIGYRQILAGKRKMRWSNYPSPFIGRKGGGCILLSELFLIAGVIFSLFAVPDCVIGLCFLSGFSCVVIGFQLDCREQSYSRRKVLKRTKSARRRKNTSV